MAKDIKEQKTHKVIKEVKELMGFLNTGKNQLSDSIQRAKQRAGTRGPLHRVINKSQSRHVQSVNPTSAKRPNTKPPSKASQIEQFSKKKPPPTAIANGKPVPLPRKEHHDDYLSPPMDDNATPVVGTIGLTDAQQVPKLALGMDHQQL